MGRTLKGPKGQSTEAAKRTRLPRSGLIDHAKAGYEGKIPGAREDLAQKIWALKL